jgi:phage repressor protein C with HTH and peptisase S24 domain
MRLQTPRQEPLNPEEEKLFSFQSTLTRITTQSTELLGQRVYKLRKGKNMSRESLGQWVTCGGTNIRSIELGVSHPSFEILLALAEFFGVSVDWLIFGRGQPRQGLDGLPPASTDETVYIPIYNQKIAKNQSKNILESSEVVGMLPVLAKRLNNIDISSARAIEVTGDSMTNCNLESGDIVIFILGLVDSDGLYAIQLDEMLIVRRLFFDRSADKVHIISENERYPTIIVDTSNEQLNILGKVFRWKL